MRQKGFASIIILLLVLVVAVGGGIVYIKMMRNPAINQNENLSISPSATNEPDISPSIVSGKSIFQTTLQSNCETVPYEHGGSSDYININKLPVLISSSVLKNIAGNKKDQFQCWYGEGNFAFTQLSEPNDPSNVSGAGEIYLYDQYSIEPGHDTYSGMGSYNTVVSDTNGLKISVQITGSQGPWIIGTIPVAVRGEKTIRLSNGEVVYANYTTLAIKEDDSRLINLLNKYSRPSVDEQGKNEFD